LGYEKGILNKRTEGNWKREFTYVEARDSSVIDYAVVNEKMIRKIKRFRIGYQMNLAYLSLEEKKKRGQEEETQENEMEEEEIEVIM